jgi:group I intron endonuclease
MYICRSLLKHGYPNFSLTILEYCEPSKCLEREDYYFQLLKPEYNTAKKPGAPMSGRTHSDESKKIMSDIKKGKAKIEGSGRVSQQIEVTDFLRFYS